MIGYLSGVELKKLFEGGARYCLYSKSDTWEHAGDLTMVYFFNSAWKEIAHQTQMDKDNSFVPYERYWGTDFDGSRESRPGYKRSYVFSEYKNLYDDNLIVDDIVYKIF